MGCMDRTPKQPAAINSESMEERPSQAEVEVEVNRMKKELADWKATADLVKATNELDTLQKEKDKTQELRDYIQKTVGMMKVERSTDVGHEPELAEIRGKAVANLATIKDKGNPLNIEANLLADKIVLLEGQIKDKQAQVDMLKMKVEGGQGESTRS